MSSAERLSLQVRIASRPGADAREIEETTRSLRREIAGLPVDSVDLASGRSAPAGTRSPEMVVAGSLLVAILPSLLPKLIEVINGWITHGRDREVEITVKKGDDAVTVKVPASADRGTVLSFVDDLRARLGGNGKSPPAR